MNRFTALLLGLAPLAGCFPVRSEQYACETSADCASGRTCDRGYCVLTTQSADAAPNQTDADPSATCMADWPVPAGATQATLLFAPCDIDAPGPDVTLTDTGATGYVLDTSGPTLTSPSGASVAITGSPVGGYLVLSTQNFNVMPNVLVRVIGATPLVIAAWQSISIQGTLDAGSTTAQTGGELDSQGPGAGTSAGCSEGTAPTAGNNNGAGGGAGGSFGGAGAAGGVGGSGNNGGGTGGVAGTVRTVAATMLVAGCHGQPGAQTTATTKAGAAGVGGGAIALTAQHAITISGSIGAGGAGGHYAIGKTNNDNARDGGGGGGSGGMIALEAESITVTGLLSANGGGGGQGRDNDTDGQPGQNAGVLPTSVPGGTGDKDSGGYGGAGGSQPMPPVAGNRGNNGNNSQGGGGGGGGGLGMITYHLYGDGAVVLPPTTTPTATKR